MAENQDFSIRNRDVLFDAVRLRDSNEVFELHDLVRQFAEIEGRTPVLCIHADNRPGCLLVIDTTDVERFAKIMSNGTAAKY